MSIYLVRKFWTDAIERAVKTFAQVAIATIGATQLDVLSADWVGIGATALGGAALSILSSVASANVGGDSSASLVRPEA